ncbi:unnamed protein product [Arctogadus glacialis]
MATSPWDDGYEHAAGDQDSGGCEPQRSTREANDGARLTPSKSGRGPSLLPTTPGALVVNCGPNNLSLEHTRDNTLNRASGVGCDRIYVVFAPASGALWLLCRVGLE